MTEIQSPDAHLDGGGGGAGQLTVTSSESVGSKRQRRPSVRLGDIGGDQFYDAVPRRATTNIKQWKQHQHLHVSLKDGIASGYPSGKGSKTRALTNLSPIGETLEEDKEVNLDAVAIGSWKVRDPKKRAFAKRVRSNWASSKLDDNGSSVGGGGGSGGNNCIEGDGVGDLDENIRDFEVENSESPLRDQSPVHSLENLGDGNERNEREVYYNRRGIMRGRDNISSHYNHQDDTEFSGPSDTEVRDDRNNGEKDGVRIWLNGLGLGRYAPVFEIHEVDDEVLPMLTLEDLKDMGINAVGSRRKMFCAIQKLGQGFS